MAREALGIVGAAVGYWIGGPAGAQIGFTVGSAIGGWVDPQTIRAPGLNEAPIQTSRDGVPIPIIRGLQYCHGNVIQKNPEEIVVTTERQGKAGGVEVETRQRFRTFAIGVCEAPIAQITRIWENSRLVYDVREVPAIPVEETEAYAEKITIYLGGEDQLPDPELEAHWGAEDTPAYRGLCYIVWNNYDLTDTGGAIPQFAFEVNGSRDATITSRPYPIEALDAVDPTPDPLGWQELSIPLDGINASISLASWQINTLLNSYSYTEGVDASIAPQSWLIETRLESYTWTEGVDAAITPLSWLIELRLVSYDYETEGVDVSIAALNWTVAAP